MISRQPQRRRLRLWLVVGGLSLALAAMVQPCRQALTAMLSQHYSTTDSNILEYSHGHASSEAAQYSSCCHWADTSHDRTKAVSAILERPPPQPGGFVPASAWVKSNGAGDPVSGSVYGHIPPTSRLYLRLKRLLI